MAKAIVSEFAGTLINMEWIQNWLIPYATRRIPTYVDQNFNQPNVQQLMAEIAFETNITDIDQADAVHLWLRWLEENKESISLNSLTNQIWEAGFSSGDLVADLYVDAFAQIKAWARDGIALYSSCQANVELQQLVLKHTSYGDISSYFTGSFCVLAHDGDAKKIVADLNLNADSILYLGSSVVRLNDAKRNGLNTIMVDRTWKKIERSHTIAKNFSQISLEVSLT